MNFFKKFSYTFINKKKKFNSKKKKFLTLTTSQPKFNWGVFKFYISKVNKNINPFLKKKIKYKKNYLNKDQIFAFKTLINNFCSNGKFLKYYIIFLNVLNQLNKHFFSFTIMNKLTQKGLNNLEFFFKFFKSDLLLLIPTYLIYFLFTKNEILFFAKAIKLRRRIAKKKKKKFLLKFFYVIPRKRFSKIIKFWKYYLNAITNKKLNKKIFKGILHLIIHYKKSVLVKYRKKALKTLIKHKKMKI